MATKKKEVKASVNNAPVNEGTGLTNQQEEFCREYIADFKGKRAATQAGYSPKTAASQASRLLTNVNIQAYLARLQKPRLDKYEVTQERIMRHVAARAFSNIADFVKWNEDGTPMTDAYGCIYLDGSKATREDMIGLAGVEVVEGLGERTFKIKMRDNWQALEVLMRRYDLVAPIKLDINHSGYVTLEPGELARRVAFMLRSEAERQDKATPPAPTPPPSATPDSKG